MNFPQKTSKTTAVEFLWSNNKFLPKTWAFKRPRKLADASGGFLGSPYVLPILFLDLQLPTWFSQDKVLPVMPALPRIVRHKAFSWKSNCKTKPCLGVLCFWGIYTQMVSWSAGGCGWYKGEAGNVEDSELASWPEKWAWKRHENHLKGAAYTSNIDQLTRHQFFRVPFQQKRFFSGPGLDFMTTFTKDWGTPEGCESLGSSVSCTVPRSEWKHLGEQLVNGNAGTKWSGTSTG